MNDYFKRLRNHPGLGLAMILTLAGMVAGIMNEGIAVWWHGALYGLGIMAILVWPIVLISNRK